MYLLHPTVQTAADWECLIELVLRFAGWNIWQASSSFGVEIFGCKSNRDRGSIVFCIPDM